MPNFADAVSKVARRPPPATRFCPKLCAGELSLFRSVLGSDVSVDRVEHILSGDRRCAYRITLRPSDPALAGGQPAAGTAERYDR